MMMRFVVFFIGCLASFALNAYELSDLWIQKSHGEYKVKVYSVLGEAHSGDYVEVDIYKVSDDGKRTILKTIELPTPGYKGHVLDVHFNSIGQDRVAIILQIEMEAMDGVTLSEVFIVDRTGKYERVIEAKYVDLYKDI